MSTAERLRALVEREAGFEAIRAQGAGGQNVNKVSSAVQLRLDLLALPIAEAHRARLLSSGDQRISNDGVLVIKAQSHRSQPLNGAETARGDQADPRLAAPARRRQAPAQRDQGRPAPR